MAEQKMDFVRLWFFLRTEYVPFELECLVEYKRLLLSKCIT